tara:strand:+ start:13840 stop:14217 length:378 start_codon:yes stop_codon:yes gene_type:complete
MTGQEKAVTVVAHRTALGTVESTQRQFSYPSPESVKGRVLADLLSGMDITGLDVLYRHCSTRAAHHILRLRQAGWPIETTAVDAPTRDGRSVRIGEYRLHQDAIDAAGDAGRRFVEEVRRVEVHR